MHLPPRISFFEIGGRRLGSNPRIIRFLGDIAVLITHWDKFAKRTTPCRDKCESCERGREQNLTGYAPAQQFRDRNWETIVYDVAQGWLADFQADLRGRVYAVRPQGACGRTHQYYNSSQPASAAFDIVQWARRYWRIPDNESIKTIPFDECLATLESVRLSEPCGKEDILPFQTKPRTAAEPSSSPAPGEWEETRRLLEQNRKRFGKRGA